MTRDIEQETRDALAVRIREAGEHITSHEEWLAAEQDSFMGVMLPLLEAWGEVPGADVPCGALPSTGWKYSHLSDKGIHFEHNCQDHGYDLMDYEYFVLPWEFITGPQEAAEALSQRLRQERAEVAQAQLERAQAALIRAQAAVEEAMKA